MKVLLLGASGQLGQALIRTRPQDIDLIALSRSQVDLSDEQPIAECVAGERPAIVLNAAAHTAVDLAESQRDAAFAVNANAVGALARACSTLGARLVHVSTDFVFDGTSSRPYRPEDPANPLNVYGASKLAGERYVVETSGLDWRIVRTAWVYASKGRNFVLTMLKLFRERREVRVVCDQVGTPTSAGSLAECVWRAAMDQGHPAILHYTDAGVASWYDFAVAIYEEARALRLIDNAVDIVPIGTEEYPTPARRPAYSVLEKRDTLTRLGLPAVHWRQRLREVLGEVGR